MTCDATLRDELVATFRWIGGDADVWSWFARPGLLSRIADAMARPFRGDDITAVVALEARGFVVGGVVAAHLGTSFVPVRTNDGLLPGETLSTTAAPDYRGRARPLRMQRSLSSRDRVLIIDDWAETGSALVATSDLIAAVGAHLVGASLIVNELGEQLPRVPRVESLLSKSDLQ